MRSFDPRSVGSLECRAWETYYRRRWGAFLVASVGLVRAAFEMGWRDTLAGAWLVLRANQKGAPVPDNHPAAAPRPMTGFYRRLPASAKAGVDPGPAAQLEAEWGRAPRLVGAHRCGHATCALLTVPLDHAGHVPGRLNLRLAMAGSGNATRGTLVFLTGGPGQPGAQYLARTRQRLGSALDGYRVVM